MDSPPTKANINPKVFAIKVRYERNLGNTTPDKILLISGNPDPVKIN